MEKSSKYGYTKIHFILFYEQFPVGKTNDPNKKLNFLRSDLCNESFEKSHHRQKPERHCSHKGREKYFGMPQSF